MKNLFFTKIKTTLLLVVFGASFMIGQVSPPNLGTPANNTTNYNFTKVTFTWESISEAVNYDLQICKDSTFKTSDLKTIAGLDTNAYSMTNFYLDFATTYYWRVRVKVGTTYSEYSSFFRFGVGTPSDSTSSNVNASVLFDHANGRIKQITYKKGSNQPLLSAYLNDKNKFGLGRVINETGTKLASWTENPGVYVYNYENPTYGSKTITLTWDASGVVVNMVFNVLKTKTLSLSAAWAPGGDIGPLHDFVMYDDSTSFTKTNLTYNGTATTLFSGNTILTAMQDNRHDEFFGFLSGSKVPTVIQQGVPFGPTFNYAASKADQSITLTFAVKSKSNFFSWASKKYVIVNSPLTSSKLLDHTSQTVTWETFGVSGTLNIDLSTDGGTTFPTSLVSGTADDSTQAVTLPDLSASVPLTRCVIKVTGTGASAKSGLFLIVNKSSTLFSIATDLTGAPTEKIYVPIRITPASTASIYALDARLEYNKDVLSFVSFTKDNILSSWAFDVTNNSSNGYIQIGGYKAGGSAITTADTLVTIVFFIKAGTRVGTQLTLKLNNTYLSAANATAQPLEVVGQDGLLTLYSRVSGAFKYFSSKLPLRSDKMVRYITTAISDTLVGLTNSKGYYEFTNKKPGTNIVLSPNTKLNFPTPRTLAVNSADASKAFAGRDGGTATLTELQKIAADVNCDGKVNSTDAYAILRISTGDLSPSDFSKDNWVFIDSSYTLTSTNWTSAPTSKSYVPLDSVKANQTFLGVIRGDVDQSYSPPSTSLAKVVGADNLAFDPNAVEYSVPSNMNVKPGDTLNIPLSVKLNSKTIGAFNSTINTNGKLLVYTGKYKEGASLPTDKGWVISTHYDADGKFNIGAADFSGSLDPIIKDGIIATFKFVLAKEAKYGDTSQVALSDLFTADSKLATLTANSKNGKVIVSTVTDVSDVSVPYEYSLSQNYPNPFNPSTNIVYMIKQEVLVNMELFNILGQRVKTLVNQTQSAGVHRVELNAKDLSSGIYFYRIKAGDFTQIRKMMLLR